MVTQKSMIFVTIFESVFRGQPLYITPKAPHPFISPPFLIMDLRGGVVWGPMKTTPLYPT